MARDDDGALGRLLVQLLAGPTRDLDAAADRAIERHLAGLLLDGIAAAALPLAPAAADRLRQARRREAIEFAVAEREIADVLGALAARGLHPLVLKGRALADAAWPHPDRRPAGDLDLLVDPPSLRTIADTLLARGYRPAPSEPPARLRPRPTGIELLPPPGRHMAIDVHDRPFRTVGAAIDGAALIARSRPATLAGHPIRVLDDPDQLHFLLVHAAKHGARNLTWLLDLHAVASRAPAATLREAARRATETATARPFWAALRLCAALPGMAHLAPLLPPLRPRWPWPLLLDRLFSLDLAVAGRPTGPLERYALELALEPSVARRLRSAAGVVERWAGKHARRG